jgi:hypothetical protein
MVLGSIVTVLVSRVLFGVRWGRQHSSAGFAGTAARWLTREVLGLAGLFVAGYAAFGAGEFIAIPNVSKVPINVDWLTLHVTQAPRTGSSPRARSGPSCTVSAPFRCWSSRRSWCCGGELTCAARWCSPGWLAC